MVITATTSLPLPQALERTGVRRTPHGGHGVAYGGNRWASNHLPHPKTVQSASWHYSPGNFESALRNGMRHRWVPFIFLEGPSNSRKMPVSSLASPFLG